MPRQSAPTKATSGGGYTFEDKVAAYFLAQMLGRSLPLGEPFGVIAEVQFQTRESGWLLDDLLLTLQHGNTTSYCGLSVKSNRQITSQGFPGDFVTDLWEQWRGISGSIFDASRDLLGLVVPRLDHEVRTAWDALEIQAITTAERLEKRLAPESKQSSSVQRKIFESLSNLSTPLPGGTPSRIEAAQLLTRVRVFARDFVVESSQDMSDAINFCSSLTAGNTLEEGSVLWSALMALAQANRVAGGNLDIPKLIGALRGKIALKDYPDYQADWKILNHLSLENASSVRRMVGTGIHINRKKLHDEVAATLDLEKRVVILGESGSGKSALVAELASGWKSTKRLLWLNSTQLDQASQTQLAKGLGIGHNLETLIQTSADPDAVLVIDGLEHLIENARSRAFELIRLANKHGWTIVITCQPWPEAIRNLTGLAVEFKWFDFRLPLVNEIGPSLNAIPGLALLFLRPDLQPILRNLAVLDQVVKAQSATPFSPTRSWIGESDLVDWIWDYWIGSGPTKHARAELLRQLGAKDGEKLSGGTSLKSVAATSLGLLRELEEDGLVRVTDTTVEFTHDLLADWARLRVLIVADDEAIPQIKREARVPRWSRAIRLYAQRLIERGTSLKKWKSAVEQIKDDSPDSINAADLFLDGIIFAANSESLLEHVWVDVIEDKGQTLQRLLRRLPHTATVPDWRYGSLVPPEHATDAAVWFRLPSLIYWIPLLRVLSRHVKDVAVTALIPASEICELWLRTMPSQLHRDAAILALELAREAQYFIALDAYFSGGASRNIFSSLLYAASEFPDETSLIALELCGRRDEPSHAIERAVAEQRRLEARSIQQNPKPPRKRIKSSSSFFSSRGPLREPAADGPARRVPSSFQSAVLDTPALTALIKVRPSVAAEVLLATCIEEPRETDLNPAPFAIDFGLNHWKLGEPEIYFKGPWWTFLQTSPKEGLEAIIRLVNYATERWLEQVAGPSPEEVIRRQYGLEFPLAGDASFLWVGDCDVFGWNRNGSMGLEIAQCALMALEKWLYDEIDKKNDVNQWVEVILKQGRSLALAGVLVSVGLKHPALFAGSLQPFLGNLWLYNCQADWVNSESQEFWKSQFIYQTGIDARIIKIFADWHGMPHRRLRLDHMAQWLLMRHPPTAEYLDARRQVWEKFLADSEIPLQRYEFLLARFDPANYRKTQLPDGQVEIEYQWPEELDRKASLSKTRLDVESLALGIPELARDCLSGKRRIGDNQVEEFWSKLQNVAAGSAKLTGRFKWRVEDAVAGGIAVLVSQHSEWLNKNPEKKKWCLEMLRRFSLKPRVEQYSPEAIYEPAESFLGEAAVALLAESDEEYLQVLAFNAITGFYYSSTANTILAAYRIRARLGTDFVVLLNVMTLWSALRRVSIREHMYEAKGEILEKYRVTLRKRYLKGKIKDSFIPLNRVELLGKRLLARAERREASRWRYPRQRMTEDEDKLWRDSPKLDVQVLESGFKFLAYLVDSPSPSDIRDFVHYARELFNMEMRTMPQVDGQSSGNKELSGTPYSYEHWIWSLAALAIVRTDSPELRREFWQPVLEWGATAHYWVRDFFRAWFNVGLPVCADLKLFATVWQDMLLYTFQSQAWDPEGKRFWFHLDDLSVDLMGIRERDSSSLREERFRDLVAGMRSSFSQWCDKWLKYNIAATWFAHFLPSESGRVLLTMGIKKLSVAIAGFSHNDWERGDLSVSLSEALRACWAHNRAELQSDDELRQSFWSILSVLCGRLDAYALQLRSEIAGSLAGG